MTGLAPWRRCIPRVMFLLVCLSPPTFEAPHKLSPHTGAAFPLQEYYAPCHTNGSLTLLFLPISRHSHHIIHSSSHAASITIASERPRASRARVSLIGNVTVTELPDMDADTADQLKACYLSKHPDAKWWLPGDENGAHIVSLSLLLLTYRPSNTQRVAVPLGPLRPTGGHSGCCCRKHDS
jgi:hypothetical protein